ncbi:MAG: hypothetical protein DSZ23_03845 [Thermodesulfatator sp.]|nr:MAG: hypothetical protein DSZ23_03845 [Thermodesulfatator sp.]
MGGTQISKQQLTAPQFIVPTEILDKEGPIGLDSAEYHHMIQVRRLERGDTVRLVDGIGNLVLARIREIQAKQVLLEKTGPKKVIDDLIPLDVMMSVIKGDRMDFAISRLSEIGVRTILPVITRRSVVRLPGNRLREKRQRWQALSLHSLKQCRGVMATRILEPVKLAEILAKGSGIFSTTSRVLLSENNPGAGLAETMLNKYRPFPVTLAVGPEGGFTPEERSGLIQMGFMPAGLGPRILRSETAAITGASVISEIFRSRQNK